MISLISVIEDSIWIDFVKSSISDLGNMYVAGHVVHRIRVKLPRILTQYESWLIDLQLRVAIDTNTKLA